MRLFQVRYIKKMFCFCLEIWSKTSEKWRNSQRNFLAEHTEMYHPSCFEEKREYTSELKCAYLWSLKKWGLSKELGRMLASYNTCTLFAYSTRSTLRKGHRWQSQSRKSIGCSNASRFRPLFRAMESRVRNLIVFSVAAGHRPNKRCTESILPREKQNKQFGDRIPAKLFRYSLLLLQRSSPNANILTAY